MELTPEQIEKFKKIHEKYGGLKDYSSEDIKQIANGVANFYLLFFEIFKKSKDKNLEIKKDEINSEGIY